MRYNLLSLEIGMTNLESRMVQSESWKQDLLRLPKRTRENTDKKKKEELMQCQL